MKELQYRVEDLNRATAADAITVSEKAEGGIPPEDYPFYAADWEEKAREADQIVGAQKGFVVYENETPVAYLGISYPARNEDLIMQHLGGFATDPDHRSFSLFKYMYERVLSTQYPDMTYLYHADARLATTYAGLSKPGVQQWLERKGYKVLFPAEREATTESGKVMLYPSWIKISEGESQTQN